MRFLIWALRPYENAWTWYVKRQYRKGKFKRPLDPTLLVRDPRSIGSAAVTTRRAAA